MASIFIYNRDKCVELNSPRISVGDIEKLKAMLPSNLEGISFAPPPGSTEIQSRELHTEDRELRIAEYLKGVGLKLEQLQVGAAIGFYNLAFRLSGSSEILKIQANVLNQNGHADQAQSLLKRVVERNPADPDPHVLRGKMALGRADYEQAQRHFAEAKNLLRPGNVEHKRLGDTLAIYDRFLSIYTDRDRLFTRDLPPELCMAEIHRLRERTAQLNRDIRVDGHPDTQGMTFFLENLDKTFEKWLDELTA